MKHIELTDEQAELLLTTLGKSADQEVVKKGYESEALCDLYRIVEFQLCQKN